MVRQNRLHYAEDSCKCVLLHDKMYFVYNSNYVCSRASKSYSNGIGLDYDDNIGDSNDDNDCV